MRHLQLFALGLFVLAVAPPAAAIGVDFGVAGGAQLNGSISDLDIDTDDGFSLGLELMFEIPVLTFGVGYEYGFPRSTDVVVDDLEYHLVYGIARIHFIGPAYVVGRVGYTSLSVTLIDLSGSDEGVSWGAGLGVKLGRFKIEALYNEFDVTVGSTDATIDYANTSLRAIFSF